jgi:hypothetical protein
MQRYYNLLRISVLVLILVGANFFPCIALKQNRANMISNVIIVDNEGDGDYRTIQDAITHASTGDTIQVYSGTYPENIIINKQLILEGIAEEYNQGNDIGKPIINGTDSNMLVTFNANNISFSGFSLIGHGRHRYNAGIILYRAHNVNISDNSITNCFYGIISNSTILFGSCTYSHNNISSCWEGMRIFGNNITNSTRGITLWGVRHCNVYQNILIGINEKDSIGIDVAQNVDVNIYNNDIENFASGIYIPYSDFGSLDFYIYYDTSGLVNVPKILYRDNNTFLNPLSIQLSHLNLAIKTEIMNMMSNQESTDQSFSRAINIYHNNFIHNTEGAYFRIITIPLWLILLLIPGGLMLKSLAYPHLYIRNHFNENYWSDNPIINYPYQINGDLISLRPSLLLFIIFLYGPIWLLFQYQGFPLVAFDFHPLDKPYDIRVLS